MSTALQAVHWLRRRGRTVRPACGAGSCPFKLGRSAGSAHPETPWEYHLPKSLPSKEGTALQHRLCPLRRCPRLAAVAAGWAGGPTHHHQTSLGLRASRHASPQGAAAAMLGCRAGAGLVPLLQGAGGPSGSLQTTALFVALVRARSGLRFRPQAAARVLTGLLLQPWGLQSVCAKTWAVRLAISFAGKGPGGCATGGGGGGRRCHGPAAALLRTGR